MNKFVLIILIGLLFGLIGSIVLLFAISYNEIPNISFNKVEMNGKLVNEDKAVSITLSKFKYTFGISLLIISFILQAIGLIFQGRLK